MPLVVLPPFEFTTQLTIVTPKADSFFFAAAAGTATMQSATKKQERTFHLSSLLYFPMQKREKIRIDYLFASHLLAYMPERGNRALKIAYDEIERFSEASVSRA